MNIANILTIARFFLAGAFGFFMLQPGLDAAIWAFVIFGVASATDWLDGYIARCCNQVTVFGQIMDPIADKALTLTALIILVLEGILIPVMIGLMAVREVMVTVVRLWLMKRGIPLPAEESGKVKTVFQIVLIVLALALRMLFLSPVTTDFIELYLSELALVLNGLTVVALFLTILSGVIFFMKLEKEHGLKIR